MTFHEKFLQLVGLYSTYQIEQFVDIHYTDIVYCDLFSLCTCMVDLRPVSPGLVNITVDLSMI